MGRLLAAHPSSLDHHLTSFGLCARARAAKMPYPLISLVTKLPQTIQGLSPLSFRCRTFETFTLAFQRDTEALDVFDSVRELTVVSKSFSARNISRPSC